MNKEWKLYLDDERYPKVDSPDWLIARNYEDAVLYVQTYGIPYHISFDHDLGHPDNLTGMDFAKWFCNYCMDNDIRLLIDYDFDFYVHSANPVGAKNIQSYMDQYIADYDPMD